MLFPEETFYENLYADGRLVRGHGCLMACMGREWFIPLWGNLLLFKMFVPELESSMGGQMWFVSTIIQFYLAWPLIVKLFNTRGVKLALIISLLWSTTVGLLGYAEEQVWNSFFLQYLWGSFA